MVYIKVGCYEHGIVYMPLQYLLRIDTGRLDDSCWEKTVQTISVLGLPEILSTLQLHLYTHISLAKVCALFVLICTKNRLGSHNHITRCFLYSRIGFT